MSTAEMKRMAESWWASHRRVGLSSAQSPSATFIVGNFFFDADGNAATQVDTAKILVGQTVLWQWVAGFHTVTNGTGVADPSMGTLFNQPSDAGHLQYSFMFNDVGTFPFFCRFHELSNMKGIVVVSAAAGVGPRAGAAPLGFTVEPWPNPSRAGVSFRFALRSPGRALAEVFDVRGRRVAVVMDRPLPAGPFSAAWDGSDRGRRAAAGTYYVRLRLPGRDESRRVVITR